jgi:hypothetical protein
MKKLLLILFACSLFTTACKKSKDAPPPPPLTKENVAGSYKIIADVTTSAEGVSVDVYANYQSCAKDDIWAFNADNSLQVTDAGIVCDPSGSFTSDWSLEGENITVAGQNGTVTKWDGSLMEVTLLYGDGSKDKITFKKQ